MISLGNILLAILQDAAKAAVARRRQERELRGMEGRDLADLGIGRSEIPFLLHETKDKRGLHLAAGRTAYCRYQQKSSNSTLVLQQ